MSLQNQPKPKVTSAKRRALVKASASAVPMVLTLRSGAAFAAASATCLARTQNNPPPEPPPVLIKSDDGIWVRKATLKRKIKRIKGGPKISVFLGPEFESAGVGARWYREDENNANNTVTFTQKLNKKGNLSKKMIDSDGIKYKIKSEKRAYVLVHFSDSGMIDPMTVGAADGTEFPYATGSCYSSIM